MLHGKTSCIFSSIHVILELSIDNDNVLMNYDYLMSEI